MLSITPAIVDPDIYTSVPAEYIQEYTCCHRADSSQVSSQQQPLDSFTTITRFI